MSVLLALLTAAHAAKGATFWMPPQASTLAPDLDWVFYFIYWVNVFFFVVLIGATALFTVQYRQRSAHDRTHPTKGSHSLEFIWAVIPTLLAIAMFVTGFKVYIDSSIPPADSMDVRVIAQKWSWYYEYPEHGVGSETLIVPADTNVRLTMSSKDVLHSFFVPDFRVKKDVVPNRYTVLWFNAPEPGDHIIYCTEFCGDGHSVMQSEVEVIEPAAFDAWVASEKNKGPLVGAALGEDLFTKKACGSCHSTDGTPQIGPPLNGIYGKNETMEDGSTALVDDNYIRESLFAPGAKIVKGYAPVMTPFQGQLTDEEVNGLIDYIKSLE
ncbi:MAG: cytochrome c oxidase subunit II [Proteobacteria bacterium]|nr:cytochrome c oxidase subunit II [Pseudomonadota bacterium]MCP4917969.1 cytochrome c oxidase subunit II [Pseudomonadota bacterium]